MFKFFLIDGQERASTVNFLIWVYRSSSKSGSQVPLGAIQYADTHAPFLETWEIILSEEKIRQYFQIYTTIMLTNWCKKFLMKNFTNVLIIL